MSAGRRVVGVGGRVVGDGGRVVGVGGRVVVVGVGNRWRRDDGAGPAVTDALRQKPGTADVEVVEVDGESGRLLAAWEGADLAVVVDAVRTGAPPGTVHRVEPGDLTAARPSSSHALGVQHAVALGRAVGCLPRRLVVVGVEGAEFGQGPGLSAAVAAAIGPALQLVTDAIEGSR